MVALNRLVEQRPGLVGALGRGGAVAAQEDEGRQADRGGVVVEEGLLGALEGTGKVGGVIGAQFGERGEDLPARLRLGALERLDKLVDIADER